MLLVKSRLPHSISQAGRAKITNTRTHTTNKKNSPNPWAIEASCRLVAAKFEGSPTAAAAAAVDCAQSRSTMNHQWYISFVRCLSLVFIVRKMAHNIHPPSKQRNATGTRPTMPPLFIARPETQQYSVGDTCITHCDRYSFRRHLFIIYNNNYTLATIQSLCLKTAASCDEYSIIIDDIIDSWKDHDNTQQSTWISRFPRWNVTVQTKRALYIRLLLLPLILGRQASPFFSAYLALGIMVSSARLQLRFVTDAISRVFACFSAIVLFFCPPIGNGMCCVDVGVRWLFVLVAIRFGGAFFFLHPMIFNIEIMIMDGTAVEHAFSRISQTKKVFPHVPTAAVWISIRVRVRVLVINRQSTTCKKNKSPSATVFLFLACGALDL